MTESDWSDLGPAEEGPWRSSGCRLALGPYVDVYGRGLLRSFIVILGLDFVIWPLPVRQCPLLSCSRKGAGSGVLLFRLVCLQLRGSHARPCQRARNEHVFKPAVNHENHM